MSLGVGLTIAIGGTLLVAAAITWLVIALGRSNKAAEGKALARLREEAPKRGWSYAERDDSLVEVFNAQPQFSVIGNPLEPFVGTPEALHANQVITGVHRGRSFVAAVFDVQHKGQVFPVGAVWIRLPAMRPWLAVKRVAGTQSRVRAAIGHGDIVFGYPGFDERFQVDCENEQFARAVITPQVASFVMNAPREVTGFAVYGDQFTVDDRVGDHRDPDRLIPALDLRCDLLDLIPAMVWT
ncbi:hypothetical protein HFP15_26675 [Amycolatopsis sp. K13G38]|uniref:DUF3137 domain-containing protein n=1 Tax=Amycolatopsis acididurans TaxID=2724524 RepID=A0ABX1JE02_9PSEU|nr:hypothetical protein [Amycolatopsis acididurans]NKQ56467.1 hypothetical protein [Amycolatopsis acididurans]